MSHSLLKSLSFLLLSLLLKNWVALEPKDNRVNFTDSKSIPGKINKKYKLGGSM